LSYLVITLNFECTVSLQSATITGYQSKSATSSSFYPNVTSYVRVYAIANLSVVCRL